MSLASYEWFNGAPKADNPRQARQQWAPHLNEWTGIVQHRFWWEAPVEPGQARIAWIDDADFWEAVWKSYLKHSLMDSDPGAAIELRMRVLFQEAGKIGNMVAFEAAQAVGSTPLRGRALDAVSRDEVLLSQGLVDWFEAFDAKDRLPGQVVSSLVQRQHYAWSRVKWAIEGNRSPILRRSISPMELDDVLAIVAPVLLSRPDAPFVQIHVLGHIMANAPSSWFGTKNGQPGLLECLNRRFGGLLHPSVDLSLVALCSGCGPNASELHKSIKALGRHFMAGHASAEGKQLRAPELNVVRNLYELRDAYDLYEVLSATRLGTQRSNAPMVIPLNGLLDGPA